MLHHWLNLVQRQEAVQAFVINGRNLVLALEALTAHGNQLILQVLRGLLLSLARELAVKNLPEQRLHNQALETGDGLLDEELLPKEKVMVERALEALLRAVKRMLRHADIISWEHALTVTNATSITLLSANISLVPLESAVLEGRVSTFISKEELRQRRLARMVKRHRLQKASLLPPLLEKRLRPNRRLRRNLRLES